MDPARVAATFVVYAAAIAAGVTAARGNWILVWAIIAIWACMWVLGDE